LVDVGPCFFGGQQRNMCSWGIPTETNPHAVNLVYVVPSDKVHIPAYQENILRAMRYLQRYYRDQLANTKTFTLGQLQVHYSSHDSNWFATNPAYHPTHPRPDFFFYNNAVNDTQSVGVRYDDPQRRWVIFVDADPGCGEAGWGHVGNQGVAVVPANSLRGISWRATRDTCALEEWQASLPPCDWVGIIGHELGHAFELIHPAECMNNTSCTGHNHELMWLPYNGFPQKELRAGDRMILDASRFFAPLGLPGECACDDVAPVDDSFLLRAPNGQYVVALGRGGGPVEATGSGSTDIEDRTFTALGDILRHNGKIWLITPSQEHYLTITDTGSVTAVGRVALPDYKLTVVRFRGEGQVVSGDTVALRTASGHYLSAAGGGGGSLNALASNPGPWETFTVEVLH
jgi:hypothetical protein